MRRKRNVGGEVCGTGRDTGSLKETLAVTFLRKLHSWFRLVYTDFEIGV